jgi:hypothetical protein
LTINYLLCTLLLILKIGNKVSKNIINKSDDLKFRDESVNGSVKNIIEFSKKDISIVNSQGESSGKTAAHFIVCSKILSNEEKLDRLHLLLNLGADFSIKDKNGKIAEDYIDNKKIKEFFVMVKVGYEAIKVTNNFLIPVDEKNSDILEKNRDIILQNKYEKYNSLISKNILEIVDNGNNEQIKEVVSINSRYNLMFEHEYSLSYLKLWNMKDIKPVSGCGEKSYLCFSLIEQKIAKTNLDMSMAIISAKLDQGENHAFIVIGNDSNVREINEMKNIVIDPHKKMVFSTKYVCVIDSVINDLCVRYSLYTVSFVNMANAKFEEVPKKYQGHVKQLDKAVKEFILEKKDNLEKLGFGECLKNIGKYFDETNIEKSKYL